MTYALNKGRFDGALDAVGVSVPTIAAAYAGWAIGPLVGYQAATAAAAAGALMAIPAMLFMRAMSHKSGVYALYPSDSDEHWLFGDLIAAGEVAPVKPTDDVLDLVDRWEVSRPEGDPQVETPWGAVAGELGELLLDRPVEPVSTDALAELLLDDALPVAVADARVVQLFAPEQLRERVDRHLANARGATPLRGGTSDADASDALAIALADLKRSLRRA